jgi:hypothetical protein
MADVAFSVHTAALPGSGRQSAKRITGYLSSQTTSS